jgi:hypothetical protein
MKDAALYQEACSWDEDYPEWYRACKKAFGLDDLERLHQHIFDEMSLAIGVFDNDSYVALLDLKHIGNGVLEIQVYARRGCDILMLTTACCSLKDLLNHGVNEIFALVATINRPMVKICEMAGMKPDGVRVLQGSIGNKVIEWKRFSLAR